MTRKKIREILTNKFNYSKTSIDKIFQGRMKPKLENAIVLEEKYQIPAITWKNKESIKSFITDDSTSNQSTKSSTENNKKVAS